MPALIPYALAIALFVVIFETVLGIMLLLGYQRRFTIWSLLLMIVFFTFLTFYSAYFNKVTDCGCFGDALKLTPWQSFTKDVVLLFFILILVFNKHLIKPVFPKAVRNTLVYLSVAGCIFMGYWVLNHLPIVDFRAYKVGNNIQQGMAIPAGAPKSVTEMIFIYKVNGKDTEFTQDDVMAMKVPEGAEFVDRKDKIITQGYIPPIHDFSMELDGSDYKDELLQEPKLLVFVAYDLSKADPEGMSKLEDLKTTATAKGYKVIAMTAALEDEIARTKEKYGLTFDFYFCDVTTLKTIERANPSLVLLEKGTIRQKLHWKDAADIDLK
jgi:hypothetical protein